jgi:hypothetical protein
MDSAIALSILKIIKPLIIVDKTYYLLLTTYYLFNGGYSHQFPNNAKANFTMFNNIKIGN